ncbi:hypothetical protein BH23PAT2_BH23PAT2_05650 [soil metagenome]
MVNDLKNREEEIAGYDGGNPEWHKGRTSYEDDLEATYNSPSATSDDLPDNHPDNEKNKSLSSNELKKAESESGSDSSGPKNKSSSEKKSIRGKVADNKKTIIASFAGLVLGGGLSMIGLLSGPLQMVHFSQILQNTHFSPNELFGRSRTGKLIKRATTGDSPNRRNMSFLGNRVADRYQSRLVQSGLELDFTNPDGSQSRTLRRVTVNLTTPEGQEFLRTLQSNGVGVDSLNVSSDGIMEVPLEGRSRASQGRKVTNAAVQTLGLNRASSAIGSRLLRVRANVSFKPLINTVRETGENIRTSYYDRRNQELSQKRRTGVDTPNTRLEGETQVNENGEVTNQTPDEPINEANKVAEDARTDVDSGKQRLRTNVNRGAGITGVICLAKGIYEARDAVMYLNIILPLIRIGIEYVALGDQVRAADEFSLDDLGRAHNTMYDEELQSSAFSADSVRAANGQDPVGNIMPDVAKPGRVGEQPALIRGINSIPGVATACGTFGLAILTVLGGPINIAIEGVLLGLSAGGINPVDYAIDWVVRALAGEEVDGEPSGALLGNYAMYGARLASNDSFISMGGRQLTDEEGEQLQIASKEMLLIDQSQKSLAQRLFDIQDVNSVSGKIALQTYDVQSNPTQTIASIVTLPFSVFKNINSALFASTDVYAQNNVSYDYGFPRFGFSIEEIDGLNETYDPFENAEIVETKLESLNEEYGECFNTTINPNNGKVVTADEGALNYYELEEGFCDDPDNEDLLRYRLYLADMITVKSLACYEGLDETSCQEFGFGGSSAEAGSTTTGDVQIETLASPLSTSGGKITPKGITLHWWGGSSSGRGIDHLADILRSRRLSVQFGITSDGKIYQMTANEDDLAGHAIGANSTTFGIEIEGGPSEFGAAGLQAYPEKFESVVFLVQYLVDKYNIPKDRISVDNITCGDVVGIHPHKAYNKCGNTKSDIDDAYFNAVMEAIQ